MIYLSDLQRRRVVDGDGKPAGRVVDLIVQTGELFPVVSAIVVDAHGRRSMVGWGDVDDIEASPVRLRTVPDGADRPLASNEVRLANDVLDHQIVDTRGRRVRKINDLKISAGHGLARLVGADVGARGYLRRLGVEPLLNALRLPIPESLITWNNVEPAPDAAGLRLNVHDTGLIRLHPADIAELLEHLDAEQGAALLGSLDEDLAADALSELDTETQEELIAQIGDEKAADILEKMDADDAADLLGDLPDERAETLLAGMDPEEAAEVRDLLRYDDESAGGIMSPDLIAIREDLTVDDAIARLRSLAPHAEVAYYLYVVDSNQRLRGVVSLRDLVTASPATRLMTIMNQDVIRVSVGTDQEEAARLISKYDLLALPVVDDEERLIGIITVDDIIDVIQQEADEDLAAIAGASTGDVAGTSGVLAAAFGRLRWLAVSLVVGLLAAIILRAFAGADRDTTIVAFGPLILLIASQAVAQSIAVVTRGIGLGLAATLPMREAQVGVILAAVTGLVSGVAATVVGGVGLAVGSSVALAIAISVVVGTLVPMLADRLTSRPLLFGQPLVGPVVGAASLIVYLGLAGWFTR